MRHLTGLSAVFPGLLTAATIALAATFLSEHYGAPVMLMALLLGMAFNFLSESGGQCASGIDFASKRLLRFGVSLLGLGITIQQITATGQAVLAIAVAGVILSIVAGVVLARILRQPALFGLLAGGAVGICGASAALAIASVLPKSEQMERNTVFTVIAVTALSTLAMIIYPILATWLGLSAVPTGVFFGATIHDVAQVVGAGYSVSKETGDTAVFVKLLRVAMLMPVVLLLSAYPAKGRSERPGQFPVPLFVVGFAVLVVVGSYDLVSEPVKNALLSVSRWCLVIAIAALGVKTSLKTLIEVGSGAIAMLCLLTPVLAAAALVMINYAFS